MMAISSLQGTMVQGVNNHTQAGYSGMSTQTDSISRNLQNQISSAQEQMQELSSNEDMTMEEKMKKKQEIQQQISDLNMQLRQHQMEVRREKQKPKDSSAEKTSGNRQKAEEAGKGSGLSQTSMQAMISADSSMKQAQVQGSVAARMEGRANVLKAEIKQDSAAGGSAERKEVELARAEQKAMDATASQISTLAGANQTMKEAAKAEKEEKEDNTGSNEKKEADTSEVNAQPDHYTPVDIRL